VRSDNGGTPAPIERVLLVSHCDFTGNSAVHAYRIAVELNARGLSPAIAVPGDPETVEDLGRPPFPVLSYADAASGRFEPQLVHAFSPRERVRKLTTALVRREGCPYVVHLEDNDRAVLGAELGVDVDRMEELPATLIDRYVGEGQVHPRRGPHFVADAAGVSVVIDALLEHAPSDVPSAVVKPGFDEAVLAAEDKRDAVRAQLGLRPEDCAIVYTGTIHPANLPDMRRLYVALSALRRDGHSIVFVKTGWHAPDAPELRQLGDGLRDLGWVPRAQLPGLLAAADILVQPGVPGPFNDYRFPAKLPDFLASGRPVVVSRTNLGLQLDDGREAVVTESGTSAEIYSAVEQLLRDPARGREIGARGRAFAMRELRWETAGEEVQGLYARLRLPAAPLDLELPPPVKLIAQVPEQPDPRVMRLARRNGIFGVDVGRGERAAIVFTTPAEYEASLRRAVLRALTHSPTDSQIVAVNPCGRLGDAMFLRASRTAVSAGIYAYYAARRLRLGNRELDGMFRLE
jgi:glycosyltransferase involved in cell wall biosynthesis